jgi:hypothetical protein
LNPVNFFYANCLSKHLDYNLSLKLSEAIEAGNSLKI